MASEKAMYWLTVGLVALGLNSTYQQGQFCWAHRIADRAMVAVERTAERGLSMLSVAEVMAGRNPSAVTRLQGALARLEARDGVRDAQAEDLAQAQRDLQELNLQLENLQGAVKVHCPRARVPRRFEDQSVNVTVPRMENGMVVVNGTQVDLRGLESLRSLESLQNMEAFKSFETMNTMQNFRFVVPSVPNKQMKFEFRMEKTDDGGTI
jgi:hypothetical protein